MTGFGLAQVKTEGSGIAYDDQSQGFVKRYTHVVYALGFILTREMYDDNQYTEIGLRRAKALAFSMRQTKEVVGANVYNRAFNSSYTGADGLELCSTAHLNKSGGTWRNELSTAADLSEASLEQACIDISDFETDRGLKIAVRPQKLLIPPELEFDAARIFRSVLRPDTANNDINALKSTGKIPQGYSVNHYFTDADAWFLMTDCPDGMKYFERRKDEFDTENDFDTENARFKATARYSFGYSLGLPLQSETAVEKPRELREHPNVESRAILSEASQEERATTIPFGSRAKRLEARGTRKGDDIVSSAWKHAAAFKKAA